MAVLTWKSGWWFHVTKRTDIRNCFYHAWILQTIRGSFTCVGPGSTRLKYIRLSRNRTFSGFGFSLSFPPSPCGWWRLNTKSELHIIAHNYGCQSELPNWAHTVRCVYGYSNTYKAYCEALQYFSFMRRIPENTWAVGSVWNPNVSKFSGFLVRMQLITIELHSNI